MPVTILRPRTLLLGLLALACLVPAAPASAHFKIGISEQNVSVFAEPLFAPLKMRYGRVVVPWNIGLRKDYWPGVLDAWLAGARANRVQPHVAFGEPNYDDALAGKGPTPARYAKAFVAFRKRWPSVRVFTPWNEETYVRAPTYKKPALAARYYQELRRHCRGCTVVAADMLDLPNLTGWLRAFLRHVSKGPHLWGIHNYRDANRGRDIRTSWTYRLTRMVKGPIWATESGGIDGLETHDGKTSWPYSPSRASASMRHLFNLLDNPLVSRRYQRAYVYNFYGAWSRTIRDNHWDSGLVGLDGKPRPAYWELLHRINDRRKRR
jgi:hypothetical protein